MKVLEGRNLTVKLGARLALEAVSLSLRPGEVTVILGPNGAGKSTLLACLGGLRRPDHGEVWLEGQPVMGLPPAERARKIAFMPQTPEIAWPLEARILVGLGRIPFIGARGLSAEDANAIDLAMRQTGTEGLAERDVSALSGGERARILLARALVGMPDWLLADEPLTGLDPGYQLDSVNLLRTLAKREGCGIVVTLHDLTLAARLADRIILLKAGRCLTEGSPAEVLTSDHLAEAYGIEAALINGPGGPILDILGRS